MRVSVRLVRLSAWFWLAMALLSLPLVAWAKYIRHSDDGSQLILKAALVYACGSAFNFTVGYILGRPRQS